MTQICAGFGTFLHSFATLLLYFITAFILFYFTCADSLTNQVYYVQWVWNVCWLCQFWPPGVSLSIHQTQTDTRPMHYTLHYTRPA